MSPKEIRSLSREEQERLRLRVVRAVEEGRTQSEVSRVFGISRFSVNKWVALCRQAGPHALRARPRGRPRRRRLSSDDGEAVIGLLLSRLPDEIGLPFPLWTWEAVQQLLEDRFGVAASRWTVSRYLADWKLPTPKPAQRLLNVNAARAQQWLQGPYETARRQARQQQAVLYWLERVPLRRGLTGIEQRARRGSTPMAMLAAVTGRGEFAFMIYRGRLLRTVAWDFLARLSEHGGSAAYLIVTEDALFWASQSQAWRRRHPPEHELHVIIAG